MLRASFQISSTRPLTFHNSPIPNRQNTLNANIFSYNFTHKLSLPKQSKPPQCISNAQQTNKESKEFATAVGLIMGTAVGPGILGLPAATICSGLMPSTLAILGCWAYVVSSILLVAELGCAMMEETGAEEVSFSALAEYTLGKKTGIVVSIVYALLNYALLIACISGLGSLVGKWFPLLPSFAACCIFPCIVGYLMAFADFKVTDTANRALCYLMSASICLLVGFGVSVGRKSICASSVKATWDVKAILPAVPVTVLTLGFHVITPFICKVVGRNPSRARRAILWGGAVPLFMVLAWNAVVLGLAVASNSGSGLDPIKLLLSLASSAAPVVEAFAFSALGTTLIGYALSFPKQLSDTIQLCKSFFFTTSDDGKAILGGEDDVKSFSKMHDSSISMLSIVLGPPIVIGSCFSTVFSKALDFAGVYANCFLFGILPPIMAWAHRYTSTSRAQGKKKYEVLLPGGRWLLSLLLVIAIVLLVRH